MYDPDSDVDLTTIPWPLLIRARFAHELDTLIASSIVRAVAQHGSQQLASKVAQAAFAGVARHSTSELSPESRMRALGALADYDDGICPPWWPWRGPRPHFLDEIGDPAVVNVLEQSLALLKAAGSTELQRTLTPALQLGARQREDALTH
jgi:hypothetical protein